MTSDEEKRWLVVGVAMVEVVAPVLRDTVKQGMDLHYNNLDAYLSGLPVPCSLNTLTYTQASYDSTLKSLKFENINNNSQTHGKSKKDKPNYNYNVLSSVDLAKLYLPDYLATFSAFDESLDLSAILRLLGWSRPAPIFPSPNPLLSLQKAADDVRDNRNKWAHANLSEWSEAFFNDCFSKLESLVKSVGLQGTKEKNTLDQLSDWQTKGCQMVMGHAVDQQLLDLVQQSLELFQKEFAALQETVEEHEQRLDEMSAQQAEQARQVDKALAQLRDENYNRMLEMFESFRIQLKQESLPVRPFDLETFRSKLADRYRRTATVPTSVWSAKGKVDIRKVYTRLSMKKEKETVPVDYTKLFMKTEEGLVPKRILVEGQAGIGKSTFVKKLSLDWVEPDKTSESEEKTTLKKFELVLFIKLRDVSHCQTLREVIRCSDLFPEEEEHLTDGLLRYVTENQEKVLLVFDGYDEYGKGRDSEVFDIFKARRLRDCCVLITSRSSQGDDFREFADVQAEVTGFNAEDIKQYMVKQLGCMKEAEDLLKQLEKQRLSDLAKVPLLSLFFCILWKERKGTFVAEDRTMVFHEIVQYILDYGHGKCTPPQFKTIEESRDILVELGKVALEGLLNDDLLFEYGKLRAIRSKVGVIHGFLQVTEDAEKLRPTERVSFIHKTIQEFLVALYIHYQCVPEGSLGPLREQANDLEKCLLLDNVFQFVCGLSDDGAMMVLDHFKAIKVLDPALDLSETIVLPGSSKQTCYDVVGRQKRFHDLVFASFQEAKSKERLLKHCTACTSGVLLLSEQLAEALLEVTDVAHEVNSGVIILNTGYGCSLFRGKHVKMFLERLDVTLKVNERSHAIQLGDFLKESVFTGLAGFGHCLCGFRGIVLLSEDKMSFYITDLILGCHWHEYWFCWYEEDYQFRRGLAGLNEIRWPVSENNSLLVESCLKYLQSIECHQTDGERTLQKLGAIAENSQYLSSLNLRTDNDDVCYFLEQIKERHFCTLELSNQGLTSTGVQNLARLLPRFNISRLSLKLSRCTSVDVTSLVTAISQSSFNCKILCLKEVDLNAKAAIMLGHSISQMTGLEVLVINGKNNDLGLPQMEALFGGISRKLPLRELELSCFRVQKAGLVFLRESFKFFPRLLVLRLNRLGMNAEDVCYLINDVSFPELLQLYLSENQLGHGITSIREHIAGLPNLFQLVLYDADCSEEDINCIIEAVRKVRPMFGVCTMTGLTKLW